MELKEEILRVLVDRAISFLSSDMQIEVIDDDIKIESPREVKLKKNTSVIGTSGDTSVLIAMGYDDKLLDNMLEQFLEGESVDDEEYEEMRNSTSCEVANIIVGNALANLKNQENIGITPPILIYEGKSLYRYKNSQILNAEIKTNFDNMLITVVGPRESFVKELNIKEL